MDPRGPRRDVQRLLELFDALGAVVLVVLVLAGVFADRIGEAARRDYGEPWPCPIAAPHPWHAAGCWQQRPEPPDVA